MHHYDTLVSLKTLFLNPLKLNLIHENVYIQTSLERRVEVAVVVLYVNYTHAPSAIRILPLLVTSEDGKKKTSETTLAYVIEFI